MENLIPWILGISGGIVCLLGWMWFSAERDLTKKRRESENTESEKQRLADEISDLRQSLLDKEARLDEAANQNQEVSNQQSRLQSDIAELRRKLELSQSKILELGEAKHTLVDLQASGRGTPDELVRLNERIAELEQELAADQAKLRELDRMRERLAEGERIRQALREENRRHQDQLAHWRQRIVESEESEKRLTLIQEQFGELLTMQAALAESQRRFQDALVGFTRLMDTPTKSIVQTVTFERYRGGDEPPPSTSTDGTFESTDLAPPLTQSTPMANPNPRPIVAGPELSKSDSSSPRGLARLRLVRKPGLAVVRAMIVVSVVGIVGVIFLFSMLNKAASTPRVIRVAPSPATANQPQPANSQSSGVVTSDDVAKPE